MRIFVTGGTGFIGSHFVQQALAAGHEVIALRRDGSRPAIPLDPPPRWVTGDLLNVPDEALAGCDALVHMAAHGVADPSGATWDDCFFWNVTAPLKLWQQALRAGTQRFVICGSCFEYGRSAEAYDFIPADAPLTPTAAYHASKAAATMAALGFSIDQAVEMIVLRPFHVYGEGEANNRFWPSLKQAALDGADFPMTDGKQVRDFIPVQSVARKFLTSLNRHDLKKGNPVIENVGTGNPRSLLKFAEDEWASLNAAGMILPGNKEQRKNEVMRYVPAVSIARSQVKK